MREPYMTLDEFSNRNRVDEADKALAGVRDVYDLLNYLDKIADEGTAEELLDYADQDGGYADVPIEILAKYGIDKKFLEKLADQNPSGIVDIVFNGDKVNIEDYGG